MAKSRISWLQILCVILVVVLLLEVAESRPSKKSKKKPRAKQCGNEGHLCRPGSRKHCCNAGFTCRAPTSSPNKTKQLKGRKKSGICKPVKPQEKEIDESREKTIILVSKVDKRKQKFSSSEIEENSRPSSGL